MAENFKQNVEALFQGMEDFVTSKTVVGEPVQVGETIIIPLVDVSFGMMASSKAEPQKHNGGGGMGGKVSPNAVLVIQDGHTRLVNIKNQDTVTKIMDLVPDVMNRILPGRKDAEVDAAVKESAEKTKENF